MIFRSLLFVPAIRPELFLKALNSSADIVCFDLEDAVALEHKDQARSNLVSFFQAGIPSIKRDWTVRINSLTTNHGLKDILELSNFSMLQHITLPKAEHMHSLEIITHNFFERSGKFVSILPIIETIQGLENAVELAKHNAVSTLMFGGVDFSTELGIPPNHMGLFYARSRLVIAARQARKSIIDMPCLHIKDLKALEEESTLVRSLGFTGKMAIHPSQIDTINRAFSISETEIEKAENIVQAAQDSGNGVFMFEGEMIDKPIIDRMKQVLLRKGK